MEKIVGLVIVALSLLAIANAALLYKRSLYFESTTRVNLRAVVANAEQLEKTRLVELAQRLVLISESDHGILEILSDRFRRAIAYLVACLLTALAFLAYLLLKHRRPDPATLESPE